ncbi:AAA family ATPase [Pectobacterium brasiliense]|uniref:ATP-dependent nuclease n=1 Tax=Pectobacterium brasiliense TaxID=180957 RepID=UPI002406E462|nr:AAA family ATPase [Pectobacterium brasiliense]MDG0806553.1 AAA family ATPase [Pectobacterium brasiliense]
MSTLDNIRLQVSGVKNITSADIEIPFNGGLYCFIGGNGCGKSTILLMLSVMLSEKRYNMFQSEDYTSSSFIKIKLDENGKELENNWGINAANRWSLDRRNKLIKYDGIYEGSLFYGTRFDDSRIVDKLIRNKQISNEDIIDAVPYVKENISFILHGDRSHYLSLKRIKNRKIARELKLNNIPYFIEAKNEKLLSQYRMSSGECLLVSLLNYIYHSVIENNRGKINKAIILIDEIELALHPIAISRLIDFLNKLTKEYANLVIYLTSHSPDVIRSLKPENMFMLSNINGIVSLINPCFPSYAIRDVYKHDGFDYLILVEDELASVLVNKLISENNLKSSRLIHVSPVGGWMNVLSLHMDLLRNNVMGINKKIMSVLDGDVKAEVSKKDEYKDITKLFLPIPSIEKFIYEIIIERKNEKLRRILNDKYFTIKSIDTLVAEHNEKYKTKPEHVDKKLYFRLKQDLLQRKIEESQFIVSLCDDIKSAIDFSPFISSLSKQLNR